MKPDEQVKPNPDPPNRKRRRGAEEEGASEHISKRPSIHKSRQTVGPGSCRRSTRLQERHIRESPQDPLTPLQAKNRKRNRSQEAYGHTNTVQERLRTSLTDSAVEHTSGKEVASGNKTNPIDHWRREGTWPKECFEQDDQTREYFNRDLEEESWFRKYWLPNMKNVLARKKSSSSLRRKQSESGSIAASSTTPSDQRPREAKSAQYARPSYTTILATKGSFMDESDLGITDKSKEEYQNLLNTDQMVPKDSLFRDDLFKSTCRKIQDRNEAMIIRDISLLIVPSAQTLATYGATHLEHLTESVNEGWNSAIPIYGPRPQPDYAVGFGRSAFRDDQLEKLKPFVGEVTDTFTSHFMATWRMYFPFLTCEVKCGATGLDVADRQNAHSMTLAVRGIVEFFRLAKCEKELHREILAFSISHDHRAVRIYGHYPVIDGDKTTFYRHPIREFSFTELDGKEKWTAYKFTKNVYDIWMPTHFKRICSVIDGLPSDIDFELSQQSELQFPESSGLSQELDSHHLSQQSDVDSASLLEENDSQSSLGGSQDTTSNTTASQRTPRGTFKVPQKRRAAG